MVEQRQFFMNDDVSSERLAAVEQVRSGWIRRLMDLSRRNNLLYYRELKTGTLDLTYCDQKVLTGLLVGKTVTLNRLLPQAEELKAAARVGQIRRRAIANLEEKGLETLFLTLGMATWIPADGGRAPSAAILLVPVTIELQGVIKLRRSGEAQINPVLLHLLRAEYGCQVTAEDVLGNTENIAEDEVPDLATIFTRMSEVTNEIQGFKINPQVVISNFSFQKMAMIKDLKERLHEMANNDIIAAIAGDTTARQKVRGANNDSNPRELDCIAPNDEFLVFDADSSQQQVIKAVLASRNGVIQGPPGAGKSQTIANLIAASAASGLRVLFVSEKRAALEVVKNRLEQKGLGHLLLDLHGADVSRREVMQQMAESLTLVRNTTLADTGDTHRRFALRRTQLNDHVARLHSKLEPSSKSAYDIQAELLKLHSQLPDSERLETRFRGNDLSKLSAEKADNIETHLNRLSSKNLASIFTLDHPSPWLKVNFASEQAARTSFDLAQRIAKEHLPAVFNSLKSLIATTKLESPTTPDKARELIKLIEQVGETLSLYPDTIFRQDLDKQVRALSSLKSGPLATGWAWLFDNNFKNAASTFQRMRKIKTSDEQMLLEVTKASEQLHRWRLLSHNNSIPCQVPDLKTVQKQLKDLTTDLKSIESSLEQGELNQWSFKNLAELFDKLVENPNTPILVAQVNRIEREIELCGAKAIVKDLRRLKSTPELWSKQFRFAWLTSCLEQAQVEDPELLVFHRENHEQLIKEFRELDRARLNLSIARVRRAHAEWAINVMNEQPEQEDLVRREAAKKARHLTLRKLLAQAPDVLTTLRPCWMTSPLSVSQLLDADRPYFDIVIFDEASQVLPEDAVPALLRAKRAVVAGDKYQLPPTTFFAASLEDEEEEPHASEGFESFLDLMSSFLNPWSLLWHYRSRDEALIAFSNQHIYGSRLITFPSPGDYQSISHVLVPCILEQDGQEESASHEVKRVVDLIVKHASEQPNLTLGVITMGIKHAQRIEAALYAALKERPDLNTFFDENHAERFFIKNIERVQGDERDAIILSIGYGKDRSGKLLYRFGPLNAAGGERRLNVAITRARQRMTLVSSFSHHDMDSERCSSKGVELLRLYIQYAASNGRMLGDKGYSDVPLNSFEQNIYDALSAKGIPLVPQWGVSGYRIDMVAKHPQQPGRFVLAIECDGASYHSLPTARERDRLRQQQLEALGWHFHRIWSTDWFTRREEEIERVIAAYEAVVKSAACTDEQEVNLPRSHSPKVNIAPVLQSSVLEVTSPQVLREMRPNLPKRSKIDDYTQAEIIALIRWILSDSCLRTDEEILKEMVLELGFKRRGARIDKAVQAAIKRVRSSN